MISVISPVYNEAENLEELCSRIIAATDLIEEDAEVLLVENGSTDESLKIIKRLRARDPRIKYISLSRNFGHQGGILAGLHHAVGDAVISIDGDLQQPPELIPKMIKAWKTGYDVVYTTKRANNSDNDCRFYLRRLFYKIMSYISDVKLSYGQSDFRLLDRKVVQVLTSIPERKIFLRGLVNWVGFSQTNIDYEVNARRSGHSKFSLNHYISFAMDGVLSFSTVPLKIFLWMGIAIASFCCIWAMKYVIMGIINMLFYDMDLLPPGSATITVAIFFLGGVQLIGIGILGEYIGRIFYQTKKRPDFIVKEKGL